MDPIWIHRNTHRNIAVIQLVTLNSPIIPILERLTFDDRWRSAEQLGWSSAEDRSIPPKKDFKFNFSSGELRKLLPSAKCEKWYFANYSCGKSLEKTNPWLRLTSSNISIPSNRYCITVESVSGCLWGAATTKLWELLCSVVAILHLLQVHQNHEAWGMASNNTCEVFFVKVPNLAVIVPWIHMPFSYLDRKKLLFSQRFICFALSQPTSFNLQSGDGDNFRRIFDREVWDQLKDFLTKKKARHFLLTTNHTCTIGKLKDTLRRLRKTQQD